MKNKDSDKEERLSTQIAYNNCNLLRKILLENSDVAKSSSFPLMYFSFFLTF